MNGKGEAAPPLDAADYSGMPCAHLRANIRAMNLRSLLPPRRSPRSSPACRAGAGLSQPSRARDRAVLARRRGRRADAHGRAGARQALGPAGRSSRTSPAPARPSAPRSWRRRRPTATRCCSRRRPTRSARRCTRSCPYDPIEDFAPISLIGREPGVLVVHPVAAGEDVPGVRRLREGAPGPGRLRVVGQRQRAASVHGDAGVDDRHASCRTCRTRAAARRRPIFSAAQVMASIPGHRRAWSATSRAASCGRSRSPARTRSPQLPDVPTVAESGVAGLRGVRVDGPARAEGHAARDHRQDQPRRDGGARRPTRSSRTWPTAGIEIVGSTPAEFGAFFRAERDAVGEDRQRNRREGGMTRTPPIHSRTS